MKKIAFKIFAIFSFITAFALHAAAKEKLQSAKEAKSCIISTEKELNELMQMPSDCDVLNKSVIFEENLNNLFEPSEMQMFKEKQKKLNEKDECNKLMAVESLLSSCEKLTKAIEEIKDVEKAIKKGNLKLDLTEHLERIYSAIAKIMLDGRFYRQMLEPEVDCCCIKIVMDAANEIERFHAKAIEEKKVEFGIDKELTFKLTKDYEGTRVGLGRTLYLSGASTDFFKTPLSEYEEKKISKLIKKNTSVSLKEIMNFYTGRKMSMDALSSFKLRQMYVLVWTLYRLGSLVIRIENKMKNAEKSKEDVLNAFKIDEKLNNRRICLALINAYQLINELMIVTGFDKDPMFLGKKMMEIETTKMKQLFLQALNFVCSNLLRVSAAFFAKFGLKDFSDAFDRKDLLKSFCQY